MEEKNIPKMPDLSNFNLSDIQKQMETLTKMIQPQSDYKENLKKTKELIKEIEKNDQQSEESLKQIKNLCSIGLSKKFVGFEPNDKGKELMSLEKALRFQQNVKKHKDYVNRIIDRI